MPLVGKYAVKQSFRELVRLEVKEATRRARETLGTDRIEIPEPKRHITKRGESRKRGVCVNCGVLWGEETIGCDVCWTRHYQRINQDYNHALYELAQVVRGIVGRYWWYSTSHQPRRRKTRRPSG